jgi:hypothetical protein
MAAGFGADVEAKGPAKGAGMTALGNSGLRQSGGFISEEFLKELHGARGMRVFREMSDNDPTVGAILFAVSMLLRNVPWSFKAKDDSAEAEVGKAFAESVFADMDTPMPDVIDEICSMFAYGYAPMEIVWKRRDGTTEEGEGQSQFNDGKIGVRSISLRAQTTVQRWLIDDPTGAILGFVQQPYNGTAVEIPWERMLLFRTTVVRNNPEGRSMLRTAYRPWYFKKRIEEVEGVGIERELAGLPVARIPAEFMSADADADQKATYKAWQKMVTNIRRDGQEGVVIPSDRDQSGNLLFDFSLMTAGGSRTIDTSKIVERHDRAIATSVLADFIFLGQAAVGSFALSSDKTDLFASALQGFLGSIAGVFNKYLMPRLWRYNAFDPDLMPEAVPGKVQAPNLAELAQLITALAGAGAALFPDRDLENFFRDAAGMPLAPEDGVDMTTPPMPIVGPLAAAATQELAPKPEPAAPGAADDMED